MFTTPCFIRKNTSELRKKLEELGYTRHQSYVDNGQYLYLNRGFYHITVIGYSEEIERMIDCETNEELFLSLAALRDDTDKHQWFIDDNTGIWECSDDELPSRYMQMEGHKASVKEIIEHFTV